MARNSLFIDEIQWDTNPTIQTVQSTHADVVVDTFIQLLREAFSSHPIYPYISKQDSSISGNPDYDLTEIIIVDKYTEEAFFLPIITSSVGSFNTHWIHFTQSPFNTTLKPQLHSNGTIKRDNNGKMVPSHYEYVGAYDGQITLNISASGTIEREELSNYLHTLLVEILRDEFLLRGIHIKTVNTGAHSEQPFRNENIYQVPVTAELYTEWRRIIPIGVKLKSIAVCHNVCDFSEPTSETPPTPSEINTLEILNCDTDFYIADPNSDNSYIHDLILNYEDLSAPNTLSFNTTSNMWVVSDFTLAAFSTTLIPYQNFQIDINKQSEVDTYLNHAAEAINIAQKTRLLASTQARSLGGGTKVLNNNFIYEDGRIEIKFTDQIINCSIVFPDDSVEIRFNTKNINKPVLIAENVIKTETSISGNLYRVSINSAGTEVKTLLSSTEDQFLDGESLITMSVVDLFMIYQFAEQPFKFTLGKIVTEIDKLIADLFDNSKTISNREAKKLSIGAIKQTLIDRVDKYLITKPLGL